MRKIKKTRTKDGKTSGNSLHAKLKPDIDNISVFIQTKRGTKFQMDVFVRHNTLCITIKEE